MYYTGKETIPQLLKQLTGYIKQIGLKTDTKELKNSINKLNDKKSLKKYLKKLNNLMRKHLDNKKLSQKEMKDLKNEIIQAYNLDQKKQKPTKECKKWGDRFLGAGCTLMGLIMFIMFVGSGGSATYSLINNLLNSKNTTTSGTISSGTTSGYNDYPELFTGFLFMMTCASFFISTLLCFIGAQRIYRLNTNSYESLQTLTEYLDDSSDDNSSDEEKQQPENAVLKLLDDLFEKNSKQKVTEKSPLIPTTVY